jgi:tetratricopeptide (TPR) repeat protein
MARNAVRLLLYHLALTASVLLLALCGVSDAALQRYQVGMGFPDLPFKTPSGDIRTFSAVKGSRLTAVILWSTWDSRSEKALSRLERLYRNYRARGLAVAAVNADGAFPVPATVRAAADRLQLSFQIFIDQELGLFHELGVNALPATIITDQNGIIVYELSGYPLVAAEEMADFIANALAGSPTGATPLRKGHVPDKEALRYFNLGMKSWQSGRMAESADTWFRKAAEADPGFALPLISRGRLYLQRGDTAQAEAAYRAALAVEPANVAAMCELALMMVRRGMTAEGKALLASAMKIDDAYTPCYYYTGLALGKDGMRQEALMMFAEAQRLNPLDHALYQYKGEMFEALGDVGEAVAAYRTSLETILMIGR